MYPNSMVAMDVKLSNKVSKMVCMKYELRIFYCIRQQFLAFSVTGFTTYVGGIRTEMCIYTHFESLHNLAEFRDSGPQTYFILE